MMRNPHVTEKLKEIKQTDYYQERKKRRDNLFNIKKDNPSSAITCISINSKEELIQYLIDIDGPFSKNLSDKKTIDVVESLEVMKKN